MLNQNNEHYYHWSKDPVVLEHKQYAQEITIKPHGLWFDVNKDWQRWCYQNEFNLDDLKHCHKVHITQMDKILYLRADKDILAFSRKFGRQFPDMPTRYEYYIQVDWPTIAKEYAGILISPYNWGLRLNNITGWYYGWDCASGCVWDTSILEMELINHDKL